MEHHNCLMILLLVIFGAYFIIFAAYFVVFGAYFIREHS